MNFTDDGYKTMLGSFRTNDLQTLLGTFGRNKAGRKSELKDRALDLLRNKPTGFNYSAFQAKIVEIYRAIQIDVPNNDLLRNMMQQSQQRQMISMGMQAQQQRMTYQPSQYSQQPMHMPRAGLPQVMPQMQRNMYGSNNIQYGSYQPAGPHNVVSQVTSNQQSNMVTTDPMVFDMNVPSSVVNNTFTPTAQPLANVRFSKLPFYEVISEVIRPITLVGQERCSLQNPPRCMREAAFKLNMLSEHATSIAMNRDISDGKNEYTHQMQIRICLLDQPGATEITDFMPLGLHIRICGRSCPLPPTAPNTRPGVEARRTARPINCTQLLKLNPNAINSITINWTPDGKTYVMGIYLVKKLSSDILLQKLKDKGPRSSEDTKNYIIRKLADVDPDLATTSYRFSLMCPLGKMRMTIPAKSIHCDHLQCFDAHIFILMNEKKPTWMCPTCNKPCLYDDIQIESYFLEVVTSPNLSDCIKEIEILADGSWKVYEETKETKDIEVNPHPTEKPVDSVNLDSDDENTSDSKKETKPESSKEPENLKSSFVDLTLSDEEESRSEKCKQENEAQAVDDVESVLTGLIPQVQPQQAVTSTEQVIEIDSPSPPLTPTPAITTS